MLWGFTALGLIASVAMHMAFRTMNEMIIGLPESIKPAHGSKWVETSHRAQFGKCVKADS
jgi:hypothetical protein